MTKWLDRSLVESPAYYCLCTSEKKYKKVIKELGIKNPNRWINVGAHATVHVLENSKNTNKLCCVVCIDITKEHSIPQMMALLVHEAVHIWQYVRKSLGEDSPSSEFEAYAIQRISLELITELYAKVKSK